MTKKLFILCMAFVWAATMTAQNIAVVSPEGETSLYKTLQEAVDGAEDGSVVYLPGGKFTGNIEISKRLTVIGIGYNMKETNNGVTYIEGKMYFSSGSTGSALMGCYVSDDICIGETKSGSASTANDILIRYNNLKTVLVVQSDQGTIINKNKIRSYISGSGGHDVSVTNNIMTGIGSIKDGVISNNIITGGNYYNDGYQCCIGKCSITQITNNIINTYINFSSIRSIYNCTECFISGNLMREDYDDNINIGEVDWNDVFVNYDSSSPWNSNFHFKDEYKEYEDQVGIYAGDGFNDKQMAPVPYIVSKHVDEQTDAQGKLNIRVRVKAGDTE